MGYKAGGRFILKTILIALEIFFSKSELIKVKNQAKVESI